MSSTRESKRAPFISYPCDTSDGGLVGSAMEWKPVLQCPLQYPIKYFSLALEEIILHPEYNSSLILRTDVLSDVQYHSSNETGSTEFEINDHQVTRILARKILPRRPGRDDAIDQDCVFYSSSLEDSDVNLVILYPRITGESLPYYHPEVRAIAFKYQAGDDGRPTPHLVIYIALLKPNDSSYMDASSRLYRTCLSLAQVVWKVGHGKMTGYQKRVTHDVIIDRVEYQNLYLLLRDQAKPIVDNWQEETDPYKHVYEDIGIVTFIMLLWKHTFPTEEAYPDQGVDVASPWHAWGRPPAGFVDLGCGNGLLVHLLVSNGYTNGFGFDVRSRKSWSHYSSSTQSRLRVHSLDPTQATLDTQIFKPGAFLIGNHADELTPWLPLIATLSSSTFLSIPCCPWNLDAKFTQPKRFNKRVRSEGEKAFEERLSASGAVKSTYAAYLLWLFREAEECGFVVETESLRIPSTRNWALVCRKRRSDDPDVEAESRERVLQEIEKVRMKGGFAARIPEGKAKEH